MKRVIILTAVWCPACIVVKNTIKKIQKEYVLFKPEYIDIDEEEALAQHYEPLKVLPIFILLDENDQVIKRLSGELSKETIMKEFMYV